MTLEKGKKKHYEIPSDSEQYNLEKQKISRGDFEEFREVKEGDNTNMNDINSVMNRTGLSKNKIIFISKNYKKLKNDYYNELHQRMQQYEEKFK